MNWLIGIVATMLSFKSIETIRNFFDRYQVLLFSKDVLSNINKDIEEDQNMPYMDLRGTPTHTCICGGEVFFLKVTFKDSEISQYLLDMQCANCGSLATAPTPVDDRPGLDEK